MPSHFEQLDLDNKILASPVAMGLTHLQLPLNPFIITSLKTERYPNRSPCPVGLCRPCVWWVFSVAGSGRCIDRCASSIVRFVVPTGDPVEFWWLSRSVCQTRFH